MRVLSQKPVWRMAMETAAPARSSRSQPAEALEVTKRATPIVNAGGSNAVTLVRLSAKSTVCAYELSASSYQKCSGSHAGNRQCQGAQEVDASGPQGEGVALLPQHGDHFG